MAFDARIASCAFRVIPCPPLCVSAVTPRLRVESHIIPKEQQPWKISDTRRRRRGGRPADQAALREPPHRRHSGQAQRRQVHALQPPPAQAAGHHRADARRHARRRRLGLRAARERQGLQADRHRAASSSSGRASTSSSSRRASPPSRGPTSSSSSSTPCPITPEDEEFAALLRKWSPKVLLVVNKADSPERDAHRLDPRVLGLRSRHLRLGRARAQHRPPRGGHRLAPGLLAGRQGRRGEGAHQARDHGQAQYRQVHPPQPPRRRGQVHRQRRRGHDARYRRGQLRAQGAALHGPRHGGHPAQGQGHRERRVLLGHTAPSTSSRTATSSSS